MLQRWNNVKPLPNRNSQTILNNLTLSRNQNFINNYNALNQHGFFNIDFLIHLMELLMLQEIIGILPRLRFISGLMLQGQKQIELLNH